MATLANRRMKRQTARIPEVLSSNPGLPWWSGNCALFDQKRVSAKQRLHRLGISDADFGLYAELFLRTRVRHCFSRRQEDGEWPQIMYPWADSLILRHLCGEIDVAIPFAGFIDLIMLDIDFKGDRTWSQVEETVQKTTAALPGEPLIYQSSQSKGVRMVWFLGRLMSRPALCSWVEDTLRRAGIVVTAGICEVRLGTSPDRLPFGYHSMLLDPFTLAPLADLSLKETIGACEVHRQSYQILPEIGSPARRQKSDGKFGQQIQELMNTGLPSDRSTNDCLLDLAWYGRARLAMNYADLVLWLREWIQSKHNGNSNRVNGGRIDDVYGQIDRIVQRLKVQPGRPARRRKLDGLSRGELRVLLKYSRSYTVLKGAYAVLSLARSQTRCHNTKATLNTLGGIGTNKCGTVLPQPEDIPNGARNFMPRWIDLSKGLLRRKGMPYASNPATLCRELVDLGLINMKRKAWAEKGKPRQYWVNFPFDNDPNLLGPDFDAALWLTLGHEGIRRLFSRHYADRIAQKFEQPTYEGATVDED